MASLNVKLSASLAILVICLSLTVDSQPSNFQGFLDSLKNRLNIPQEISPHFVALYAFHGNHNGMAAAMPICSGTIIGSRHVLTAARCFLEERGPDEEDSLVDHDEVANFVGQTGDYKCIRFEKLTLHPSFDIKSRNNNLAILRTVKPIPFSNKIQPIALQAAPVPMQGGLKVVASNWNWKVDMRNMMDPQAYTVLMRIGATPDTDEVLNRQQFDILRTQTMTNEECSNIFAKRLEAPAEDIKEKLEEEAEEMDENMEQELNTMIGKIDFDDKLSVKSPIGRKMQRVGIGSPLVSDNKLVGVFGGNLYSKLEQSIYFMLMNVEGNKELMEKLEPGCQVYTNIQHYYDWIMTEMENI